MAIIKVGDDFIDEETGEYAGPADNDLRDSIESEDDLLWYMRRLMQYQSALQARQRELDAVIDNCRKIVKDQEARLNWLKGRYEAEASVLAQTLLPRKSNGDLRSKTYQCPWGKVSFRTTPTKVAIWDKDLALDWCKSNAPEAVVVSEAVHVSKLPQWMVEKMTGENSEQIDGFSIVEGGESVTFTTI